MKYKVSKELQILIKSLNTNNEVHENNVSYVCDVDKFMRGGYAATILYKVFFSTDLSVLMDFVNTNNLSLFLGSSSSDNVRGGRIYIQ